jgi:hypothetical protein
MMPSKNLTQREALEYMFAMPYKHTVMIDDEQRGREGVNRIFRMTTDGQVQELTGTLRHHMRYSDWMGCPYGLPYAHYNIFKFTENIEPIEIKTLLTTPEEVYWYAYDVLKAPFPSGEATIAENDYCSYWYAKRVLKHPNPDNWAKEFKAKAKDGK